jgi:hypothetical protein
MLFSGKWMELEIIMFSLNMMILVFLSHIFSHMWRCRGGRRHEVEGDIQRCGRGGL